MEHWIRHPSTPKQLILAWQAPSTLRDRVRWAVGRVQATADGAAFDYFDREEFLELNLGRTPETLHAAGYAGYPAFDLRKRPAGGWRDHVLEAFLRRLPPTQRADFADYLAYFRVLPTTPLSPLSLLSITEARLPSDGFSLIDPLDPAASRVDVVGEIAGFRHCDGGGQVSVGEPLELAPEPTNTYDPNAVEVRARGQRIGYLNRLQAPTVLSWLRDRSVRCWVARLNGRPDAPRAFAYLEVQPTRRSIAA